MTATTVSPFSSPHQSSPFSFRSSPQYPIISPKLQSLLQSPRSPGSYGCEREVFHPLSPRAEPSAILYYDSSEDDDGEASPTASKKSRILSKNATTPSPLKRMSSRKTTNRQTASPVAKRSPLKNETRSPSSEDCDNNLEKGNTKSPSRKDREKSVSDKHDKTQSYSEDVGGRKRPSSVHLQGWDHFSPSMNAYNTFGEESPFKRPRGDQFPGENSSEDGSSNEETPESQGKDVEPDIEKIIVALPGSFAALGVEDAKEDAKPPEAVSEPLNHSSSASNLQYPSLEQSTPVRKSMASREESYLSPARMPLPDSDSEDTWSEVDSVDSSPTSTPPYYGLHQEFEPLRTDSHLESKNSTISHAQALAKRLAQLDRKAQEYSILISRPLADKKYARRFDAVYNGVNRFDAREAAELEEKYQQKIRAVWQRQRDAEIREEQLRREEEERKAREAAEAARKAAEEKARREEEERRRKEQEEQERKRREEAVAKAQADKLRAEEEAKKQAAAKAQLEQEAKAREAQDKAAANAQAAIPAAPQVYGRKSVESEREAVLRILKNLKEVRKMGEKDPAFLKSAGLGAIRRDLRPKFGQLNGEKAQTIAVRDHFKRVFEQVKNANGPTAPISNFLITPPQNDVQIPLTFVWTVNELAKLLVQQVVSECAIKPDTADPIGVAVVSTFADEKFLVEGKSFLDIVIARLLKRNPILLGMDGPEDTEQARHRLGWKKGDDGKWESEEDHINRLVGLTAGYTAIAGRDFRTSKMTNPYPMFNLWHAIASLLNKPVEKLTNSHFFVMKTLLQLGAKKLVAVYGRQAKKLVEVAVTDWANKGAEAGGYGGASAVRAYGKTISNEAWWKE